MRLGSDVDGRFCFAEVLCDFTELKSKTETLFSDPSVHNGLLELSKRRSEDEEKVCMKCPPCIFPVFKFSLYAMILGLVGKAKYHNIDLLSCRDCSSYNINSPVF